MGATSTDTATGPCGVATFNISVEGKSLEAELQVLSITVIKELNKIPLARIVIRDGDAAEKDFAVSNQDNFVPGKKIIINLGTDSKNAQAFKGIVTKHAIRIRENGSSELHVECRDAAVKMTIGRHNKYYENMKDSQLFDDLIGKYKPDVSGDTQATTLEHKQIVQHHISDWDFMLLRAEANGMLVNTSDGKITIAKPDTGQAAATTISFGSSVLEFEAEMDSRNQWKNVVAQSWNYTSQDLFKANSDSAKFAEPGNIPGSDLADTVNNFDYELHHSGYLPEQELQDWVDGTMLRSRIAKIRGRVRLAGNTQFAPGTLVKMDGVGNRFNGNVFVTAVKHEVGNGKWDTHLQFGLDPRQYAVVHEEDLSDVSSAGLASAIRGLQIGKVVQLQNDPDGENRILVKTPTLDNAARGIWTRVASLDAGSSRGAFFLPEINDEVIVGFINDDPRHAVMLGMLHSSAKPAPITAQDANNEKGFTTRSKMHVSFNDDTKTIVIDTPAGNSIKLDESGSTIVIVDQNSNKMTMDTNGIKLESPMNVEIKAGVNLTLSAGATLSIGGLQVSIKADADASIEGAMSKLSSQGITEVSGSIVKIN
jgi:Rhs element Vgr protein